MSALTPEEREHLARKAASARWANVGPDDMIHEPEAWGDLPIVGHKVPCAVILSDGEVIRIVSERGLMKSFGGRRGPGSHWLRVKEDSAAANLPAILSPTNLREFISPELMERLNERFLYKIPGRSGMIAHGLRAELYPMICDVWLKARDAKALFPRQEQTAKAADVLMRALAHTGIIALVDEATGYQARRAPDALARILEAFIAKVLQPYVRTFPDDYYEHLFRLRGLDYKTDSVQRPQYFGCLTNDIVYRRLAPGVLAELKKVTIRNEDGRPKHKYFQRLTSNLGYPKLREHLGAVVAIMKLSIDYPDFMRKLNHLCPPYNQTLPLPFDMEIERGDTGKGL